MEDHRIAVKEPLGALQYLQRRGIFSNAHDTAEARKRLWQPVSGVATLRWRDALPGSAP